MGDNIHDTANNILKRIEETIYDLKGVNKHRDYSEFPKYIKYIQEACGLSDEEKSILGGDKHG